MKYLILSTFTLLFCLSGYAQQTVNIADNLNYNESVTTEFDTVKNKKGEILQEVIITPSLQKTPIIGKVAIKPMDLPQSTAIIGK